MQGKLRGGKSLRPLCLEAPAWPLGRRGSAVVPEGCRAALAAVLPAWRGIQQFPSMWGTACLESGPKGCGVLPPRTVVLAISAWSWGTEGEVGLQAVAEPAPTLATLWTCGGPYVSRFLSEWLSW